MMRALLILAAALAAAPVAGAEALPRPSGLEPNVRFWTRIYSEVDGNGGLIHDSEHLDVVYEQLRLPAGSSSRARERRVTDAKRRVRDALRVLASGRRSGLSKHQEEVLSRWPADVSNATLRKASERVRFQLGQADKFRAGLVRAGAWRGYIEEVLARYGVPGDLVALPHVESSFNPTAYSRVGAAGLWQFTRSTGRRYLRVDHVVDERMDPFRATDGAARLLRDNYRRLESWPLAITAYNHGVSGMARAVRQVGTRDMGEISRRYRSRTFGFASRNFYAELLAAIDVDRNAVHLFGPFQPASPVEYDVVELDHYYTAPSLERAFGVSRGLLREHNPALRSAVWNGSKYAPRGFALRLPRGASERPLQLALADVPSGERFDRQHRDTYYKVRRGDTLSVIARRHGVTVSQLVALNNLRSRNRIRVGQVLVLPDDARGAAVHVARQEPPADGVYRVRRGDNLTVIGARFGVSPEALARENGLRNRNVLHVGQALRLPGYGTEIARAEAPERPITVAKVETPTGNGNGHAEPATAPPAAREEPTVTPPEPAEELEVEAAAEPEVVEEPELADAPPAVPNPDAETELGPVVADPPAATPVGPPSPDPSNYAVTADGRIVVQAEETLGHYAEWLETRASQLRRLNRLRYGTPVVIGRTLRLDFSRVTPELFEQRRLAYHHALQEEFFSSYLVTGTATHVLRRGETLWYLAERKFRLPVWLLRQYNPDLDFAELRAGTEMVIPEVEPRV